MTSRDHRRRLVPTAVIGALLAIGLASSLWAATASAGTPRGFWGVSAWANPSATELARIGKGGVRTFRFPFYWGGIETQRGSLFDAMSILKWNNEHWRRTPTFREVTDGVVFESAPSGNAGPS